MTPESDLQQNLLLEIERALQQAMIQHQEGQLQGAEDLYRAILQVDPNQADANHNLGVLLVQTNQPAASLPYFLTALNADSAKGQYWISYIDALIQAGQLADARQILTLATQQGLESKEVDVLALRLEGEKQTAVTSAIDIPVVIPDASQKTKGKPKAKPATNRKKHPGNQEMNTLSVLFSKGRYAEAADLARKMTERYPLHPYGWKALGAGYRQTGQNADALIAMKKAAELAPDDIESHNNLGNLLRESGFFAEALTSFRRVIEINSDNTDAHCNLGVTLRQLGHLNEAEASYRRALQINPLFAEAHNNLGNTLKDLGRLHEAEACYRQALKIKPDYANAHNNLGATLRELGKMDEAVACYRRALQLNPAYAEAHSNLGFALRDLGQFDEALANCQRALELKPDYADAHSNMGGILKELGQLDEAIASCRMALKIKPDLTEAHNNLGNALQIRGDSEAAIASYRQALTFKPDYTMARYNLGFAQLACGHLTEGWANHEFRTCIDRQKYFHQPYWAGENLQGKTILIRDEQGIGDEIMFASLFSEIIVQAGRCVIECTEKLVPLFTRSFPGAQVVTKTEPPHPATHYGIDYQCAAGSLALWLRPTLASFPQQNSFLKSDPARVAYWKTRLAKLGPGPKIGFCWRSSLTTGERPLHYTMLDQWGPIFTTQGVHFINLQYDECSAELEETRQRFGIPLHNFPEVDMYNDLDETAALIQAMDLVITAPTAVSSISAALAINTWVMNYGVTWETHGTDQNLWFPSMHYFSRRWNQGRDEIIEHISGQLKSHILELTLLTPKNDGIKLEG
jgi:tetratricopeptide (TPR) repeat protein